MNKFKNLVLVAFLAIGLTTFAEPVATTTATSTVTATKQATVQYLNVAPLNLIAKPNFYVNKNVEFSAKFDKFVTLGLDYKPAFRSSEEYISFLIQRPDVTDHNVPLSELKIFIDRKKAEKFIELTSGDEIKIQAKVFSDALTDCWIEVDKLEILNKVEPKETK